MNNLMLTILEQIAANKRLEVEQRKVVLPLENFRGELTKSERDFAGGLKEEGVSLIAEVKRSSPSEGLIKNGNFDPVKIAKIYENAGAKAISVLTDKKYFGGDLAYLQHVAEKTESAPLLCKDFIIDEYQIFEARKFGADAILLIKALLPNEVIEKFLGVAKSLGMDALCEVHSEVELKEVLKTTAEIIGVNNRDLHSFEIDLGTTSRLAAMIPEGKIIVAESGINSGSDVESLPENVDGILVGTSLMRSVDPKFKIQELIGKK